MAIFYYEEEEAVSSKDKLKKTDREVLVYRRAGEKNSSLMARAFVASEGSFILVAEPSIMSYDHKDHRVFELLNLPPGHFVMFSDAEEAQNVIE